MTKCTDQLEGESAMNDVVQRELLRRLDALAPLFGDLGARTVGSYSGAGILEACPDDSFPVSDALFTHKEGRYVYHPHGPVYLYVTRQGELQLAGQGVSETLAQAVLGYTRLAGPGDLEGAAVVEGATEWFPPPRFMVDPDTSGLYIAAVSHSAQLPGPVFLPFEDYVAERTKLFVTAFRNSQ
jgi:hypothetical protein